MINFERAKTISKILSSNDIGITGAHQAGIHVPKTGEILSFFPKVDVSQKNPRHLLVFFDDTDERWEFSFIYYNNKLFGGTRNEYRLTRMTTYIKRNNLKVGDELILINNDDGIKRVSYKRALQQDKNKLRLSTEWKIIQF